VAVVNEGLEADFTLRQGGFGLELQLAAGAGETVVLVGPSGSGKSTALRAVAGLARPRTGRIAVAGRAVFDRARGIDLPPWKRRVGVVFQDYALFPHLTVAQNVCYGLRGRKDARARAGEWLESLAIAGLASRKPGQLSGGQQQRVALARAAAADAEVLLLDEPFGSLDAATRRSVRGELRRFLQRAAGEAGRTTVLVTHDYLDALTLGDRIVVLEGGRITQEGRRDEVLRRPRTPFLAELTGHNVLEGTAGRAEGEDLRGVTVGPLLFHVAAGAETAPGAVYLSFGPQEVSLMRADAGISARNRFPAVVREIVPLPDRLRVHLDAGVPLMADVVRSAATELGLDEGTRVVAAVKSTAIEIYT
jgi:molybdate transport system ATP-binding protein